MPWKEVPITTNQDTNSDLFQQLCIKDRNKRNTSRRNCPKYQGWDRYAMPTIQMTKEKPSIKKAGFFIQLRTNVV
jgi:hypothetical protein